MPFEAVDILPGAVPGGAPELTSGALAAPLGAGVVWLTGRLDIAVVLLGPGDMFPGAVPEGVTCGALTAPVGAGLVTGPDCAQAMPVLMSKAVEANHNDRMMFS